MASPARSACLDEATLAALIDGRLDLHADPELEAHLAACSDCRSLIGAAATGVARTDQERLPVDAADLPRVGEVLAGKYRIVGVLGRGGMGMVFAARHLELGQNVAIKLMHSGAATAAPRFLREATTSAQLVNEHIARVFDLGRLPNGTPFIVMEYLVGEDLASVIARGPVSPDLALEYALQACRALAEAHAAGVVHRDLKPGNLFITRRADGSPWLKVLDFGISKRLLSSITDETLTGTAAVLGSPVYMSPEQIRASKDVDARTDIWSLGVVLYELLLGRRPFTGPTLSALAVSIATDTPASAASLKVSLPKGLEAVLERCLAKEPAARYASITHLAAALREALPDRAQPTALSSERTRWLRPRPVLLLGLAGSTALALLWLRQAGSQRPALAAQQHATTEALPTSNAAARPAASIRCASPLPPGELQLFFRGTGAVPSEHRRSLPVATLCSALPTSASPGESAASGSELRAVLDNLTALTAAALEPPHPFYSIELHAGAQPLLELKRAARLQVQLRLLGASCASLHSVRVLPEGLSAVPAQAALPAARHAECSASLELPFEAFGKSLGFEFEAPGYAAAQLAFTGSELEAQLELPKKPRIKAKTSERCAPPHFYNCRE